MGYFSSRIMIVAKNIPIPEMIKLIDKEIDKAQKLADWHAPILGIELADHFNYMKLMLSTLKESK